MTKKSINRSYETKVKEIFSDLMGRDFVKLVSNPSYPDSIVYTGVGHNESLVFKMMDPKGIDKDRIAAEGWALTKARSVGVPTPQVIQIDDRFALYGILRNMTWALRWHDVWPEIVSEVIREHIDHAARHFKMVPGR
ncbi:MAG: hypothetical protein AAF633_27160 [Chloroflexota bacterium]